MEVLFCDTFVHDSNEDLNLDLVRFSLPVSIHEVRVIPRGFAGHSNIRDESRLGQTSPHAFKLELFINNLNNSSAIFERLGTMEYKDSNDIQLIPKAQASTEGMVLRGRYNRLTLLVLGVLSPRGSDQRSPSPPPPPPPPPKQVPQPSKRPIDPEPVQSHQPVEQSKPANWEWTRECEALAKRPRYAEPDSESMADIVAQPSHIPTTTTQKPISSKKGPRTPSPPHPATGGSETWEPRRAEDASHVWPGGNEGRAEWQTTDTWDAPVGDTGAAPDHGDPGEGWENWKTTDSWEPGWDEGNEEDWDEDAMDRIHRGPRTPPGEPECPQSPEFTEGRDEEKRSRDLESSDVEDEAIGRRGEGEGLFEPLSPEQSPPLPHRRYSLPDVEIVSEAERQLQRSHDPEETDSIGHGYEEILSDEEVIEDVDDLRGLIEAGLDLEGLEDETWPELIPYDPFQNELVPLKTFGEPEATSYEMETLKLEDNKPTILPKEAASILEMVEEFKDGEHSAKWVVALEELLHLVNPWMAHVWDDVIDTLSDWTLEALNYDVALKQAIAVNIRQLKAGMKLAGVLCDCGPAVAGKLLAGGVQESLMKLLFAEHMASSLKLMAVKALDSTTNWQSGIDRFLGIDQPVSGTDASGYQQLLKFVLSEQTVRVVTASATLLNKLHLYEVLFRLADFTDSIIEKVPAPEMDMDAASYQTSLDCGADDVKSAVKPLAQSGDETGDAVETGSVDEDRLEGDTTVINTVDNIVSCLDELLRAVKTAPHAIVQPRARVFPTSVTLNSPPLGNPWPVMCHMFKSRNLLECLLLLLSCPATTTNDGITGSINELLEAVLNNWSGLLYLFSHLETCKALFQSLTNNYDEESTDCGGILHQLGLHLMYTLSAVQFVDILRQHQTTVDFTDRTAVQDSEDLLDTLCSAYTMGSGMNGRVALAKVLGMEDNLECLLPLAQLMETRDTGEEQVLLASKKTATYGYAAQLLTIVVQYSDDITLLHRYSAQLLESCTEEHVVHKWTLPLKDLKLDASCISKLVDHIHHNCADLPTSLAMKAPGILTCLRGLDHITCSPQLMASKVQQLDLKYKMATMQLFSCGALNTFITCMKKVSDIVLRPWQQGISLSSGHAHMLESIMLRLVNLVKTMLTQLLDNKDAQYCDDRLVSNLILLHTVMCSAPPSGMLSDAATRIQASIVDVLLTFTKPMADITEAEIAKSCWTLMLHTLLDYIPSAPYSYMGGLSLLSELLPLPLPMQTQESLSEVEVQQALNLRRLWSLHLHSESTQLQSILTELSLTSSPLLQHLLRRISCQLADLAGLSALTVVRSLLQALLLCLENPEEGGPKERPCSADAARVMTLLVYLSSQPAIKVALLHLCKSSSKSDEKFVDLLPRLLTLLNLPSPTSSHQQAQECIVTILQSLCDPEITLLSTDNLSISEQLASSLPGKEYLDAICVALLDHVTGPHHSYASILPALRMLTMLLDHDYGFFHVKSAIDKKPGAFFSLLSRLTDAFSRESSDYLSTLSNTLDLLHLLLTTEGDQETPLGEEGAAGGYRTRAMDVKELGETLKWSEEVGHPLRKLEKILVECCKDDETMEHLLDTVSSLAQALDTPDIKGDNPHYVMMLPSGMSLHEQFNSRLVYYISEEDDERLTTGMWMGQPSVDEMETEPEMVKCDLEEICAGLLPNFDLQAELSRGLGTEDVLPDKKKKRALKTHYDPLIYRSGHRISSGIRRAHRGYGRPEFSGRGRGYGYDLFRQRAQNTSRPPSMHVDDFVAAEQAHVGPGPQQKQRGPPGRSGRGDFQRGGMGGRGNFHGNQAPWNGPNNYRRENTNPMGRGASRGRGQWGNRQQRGPFEGGPRGGGGGGGPRGFIPRSRSDGGPDNRMDPRDQSYNRSNHDRTYTPRGGPRGGGVRGANRVTAGVMQRGMFSPRRGGRGYRPGGAQGRWGSTDGGNRFTSPKPMRGNRMGGRDNQGRHSRSFTR